MKNVISLCLFFNLLVSCTNHNKTITKLQSQNDSLKTDIDSITKKYSKLVLKQQRLESYLWKSFEYADSALNLEARLGTKEAFINYFLEFPYDTLVSEENEVFPLSLKSPNLIYRLRYGMDGFFPFNNFDYANIVAWYAARIYPNAHLLEAYHTKVKYLPNIHSSHQQITSYFIHHFNRNPENIEKYFKKYETTLYEMVDKELYQTMQAEIVVNQLLSTHAYLLKNNYLELFKHFDKYQNVNTYSFNIPENQEFMEPKKNEISFAWCYKFWYRRYLEGNMEIVYEILKKIKQHYDKLEIIIKGRVLEVKKWNYATQVTIQTPEGKLYTTEVEPERTTQFKALKVGDQVKVKGDIYFSPRYADGKQLKGRFNIRIEKFDFKQK